MIRRRSLWRLLLGFAGMLTLVSFEKSSDPIAGILERLRNELSEICEEHAKVHAQLIQDLNRVEEKINLKSDLPTDSLLSSLESKGLLLVQIRNNSEDQAYETLKVRYKKGIEIIRVLYEKILGLDHHFTGLETYQNILTLSNPNHYPEFQRAKGVIEEQLKKKNNISIPDFLQSNPYIAATFTLVGSLFGSGDKADRQKEFESIACILDFTLRMNGDLSVIHHETEYLQEANKALLGECEQLFEDYVGVIDYFVSLEKCRQSDQWESLNEEVNTYVESVLLDKGNGNASSVLKHSKAYVNLEFATKRVADFISKYSSFIEQGTQYYLKFDKIVSSYEHEATCGEDLPNQYGELKKDIKLTIDKFHNTYNLPEIDGSRLKDLMYGTTL